MSLPAKMSNTGQESNDIPAYDEDGYYKIVWKPENKSDVSFLISDLVKMIKPELNERGFEECEVRVRTVLEEAIVNAWLHGNKEDFTKSITVRWHYDQECHIEVIDEGQGFDYTRIPDPTKSENLTKPNGRGVFIIKHFADHVGWNDGGTRLMVTLSRDFNQSF